MSITGNKVKVEVISGYFGTSSVVRFRESVEFEVDAVTRWGKLRKAGDNRFWLVAELTNGDVVRVVRSKQPKPVQGELSKIAKRYTGVHPKRGACYAFDWTPKPWAR